MMRSLCLNNQQLSNDFLNGVLNQLNWAFSEFVGILQEVFILKSSLIGLFLSFDFDVF